jgi:phage terminase large subunit-like protein
VRAGPKAAVDASPLPLRGSRRRELAVSRFATDYIRAPRGHGVRKPLRLRPWQRALIATTWDRRPAPRLAGWMLPRGQGKTSLTAVLALYELLAGAEGAQVVVVATDERQAGLCHRIASRMVELHPELEARVQQYADQLTVPSRGSSFQVLPAVPKRLEGLDFTLAIVDEAGRVDQEVYEVVALATGKQKASVVLAIGTPGPELEHTVLGRLRTYALDHPGDHALVWREHSAAGFEDHPVDCRHCWELANPALDDFLARDGLAACLPPKMREASFRRARLCQLTDQLEDAWLPPSAWAACTDATRSIPDGAEVVLAFDGSFNGDTTVLVVATVAERPHVDLVELWEAAGNQVPIVDVEAAIRAACRRWRVLEIAADPFRWARSLQLLDGEGLPILDTRSRRAG